MALERRREKPAPAVQKHYRPPSHCPDEAATAPQQRCTSLGKRTFMYQRAAGDNFAETAPVKDNQLAYNRWEREEGA